MRYAYTCPREGCGAELEGNGGLFCPAEEEVIPLHEVMADE